MLEQPWIYDRTQVSTSVFFQNEGQIRFPYAKASFVNSGLYQGSGTLQGSGTWRLQNGSYSDFSAPNQAVTVAMLSVSPARAVALVHGASGLRITVTAA